MRKKLLMVFGLGSALALTLAFADGQARPPAGKEAQKAAIAVEGKAYECRKAESHCLRKSGTAAAKPSGDANMASSGSDCPKSADCPKADCDKSQCLKKTSGHFHADPSEKVEDKPAAESET